MKSNHPYYPSYWSYRNLYPTQYTIAEGLTSGHGFYFVVTGFDKPVGRRYIDPTAGTYEKQVYQYPQGYEDNISTDFLGGMTGHTRIEGGMSNAYGTRLFGTPFNSWNDYDSSVYNRALSKLYENVKLSESNLALTIGEAKESGKMLQVGKSMADVLTLARRAKSEFLRNPSKSLSKIWLSYKYGWQPLYTDVYNYLNWAYTAFNEGVPVVGRSRRVEKVFDQSGTKSVGSGLSVISGQREYKAEIKCWIGLADTDTYNLSRITSLNPLSIAWELVPLSFVVDWFYDVGGYLQNMEAALGAGVSFKRGYETEVSYINLEDNCYLDLTEPGFIKKGYRQSKWVRAKKRRDRLLSLPFPRAPSLNLKLGASRILSAAALIRVILLGKAR